MDKSSKVDLTLIKRYVSQLEKTLDEAAAIKTVDDPALFNEYVIELAKAVGLASGAAMEASMLVADIQALVKSSTNILPKAKDELTKDLMALLKGDGGTGGGFGGFGGTN